ncbi:MAG: hypothetical protein LBC31_00885 [Treponema sp.]|jgi:hypothetical protein|nr:hypothetical protein [Treponema sp.]
MKYLFVMAALVLTGCGEALSDSGFGLALPALPPAWTKILGSPSWRIQWINSQGEWESRESPGSQPDKITGRIDASRQSATAGPVFGEIELPVSGSSPVLAWPFWPNLRIFPGDFHPAGAIFPFDVSDGDLILSWEGGVAAFFYRSLAEALAEASAEALAEASGAGSSKAALRQPGNFDWPRFRELLRDPILNESFQSDPWTVDWKLIARETVASGFEKRRLVPVPREELAIPVHPGPWISASPFPEPLLFGEDTPVFSVPPGIEPDTWYSAPGILRCAGTTWIFLPWQGTGSR